MYTEVDETDNLLKSQEVPLTESSASGAKSCTIGKPGASVSSMVLRIVPEVLKTGPNRFLITFMVNVVTFVRAGWPPSLASIRS